MLYQVFLSHAAPGNVGQQAAHDIQLVKTGENLLVLLLPRLWISLLDNLGVVLDDVRQAARSEDPFPEVIGLDAVGVRRVWVRGLPFPNAMHLGHPFQWKNTLPWHLGPAAKVRILRFKIFRHSRYDPSLQNHVLRYSPGLAPTTRLNALLNEASDS